MNKSFVAILLGSDSDITAMEAAFIELKSFGVAFEAHILSAHRNPTITIKFVKDADKRGCAVFIAAAGLAAHLAGTVAAHTIKPVIGVPMAGGSLGGLDALLSTVQMPGGIPVACTAIGKAGAKNAAILAVQIMALQDSGIAKKLREKRELNENDLKEADEKLQKAL